MSWPAYLDTYRSGELARRVEEGLRALASCRVCPRDCKVDRLRDEKLVCKTGRHARVSSYFPHFGEEDVLRGWNGSGTIFFAWCNLGCVFCQNWDTSREGQGAEAGPREIAAMMIDLQARGCHNLNFVTPEHVVPQILEALICAIERGLRLPLVYNTGAFDSLDSLRLMDGVVDIYMPDFKYWDPHKSARYLKAKNYPEAARAASKEMHRQVGDLVLDDEGVAVRGVLLRHLVMPGGLDETRAILEWVARELSPDTWVNLMDQYRPAGGVLANPGKYPELSRPLAPEEIEAAFEVARHAGLRRLDARRPHPRLLWRARLLSVVA